MRWQHVVATYSYTSPLADGVYALDEKTASDIEPCPYIAVQHANKEVAGLSRRLIRSWRDLTWQTALTQAGARQSGTLLLAGTGSM